MTPETDDATDAVTELTFTIDDPACPLVRMATETDCRVDVLEAVRSPPETVVFLRVDADARRALDAATACDRTKDAEPFDRRDEELLVELVVDDSVLEAIADAGAVLGDAHAESGAASVTTYLPPTRTPEVVVETVQDDHPAASVVSVTERPVAEPFLTREGFGAMLRERLTDRQWETLRLAHQHGYFERPRELSQAALAEEMDISGETVSQHLRAAQRHLLSLVFESGVGDE